MKRKLIQNSPIFGAAGVILFLFLAALWNFAVERDFPKLRIRSDWPLEGVAKPEPAPWTLEAFLAGETQKAASRNLGQSLPAFPMSVRVKNQFLYSLYRVSGAPGILVGRKDQLFERVYVEEFCRRGAASDAPPIAEWANRLGAIRDRLEALGKSFVYLVSPSKAARYPQYLPRDMPCPALGNGRAGEKLAPFLAELEKRQVPHVDGAGLMSGEMGNYPIDLFARGGTHWNHLGAALAARQVWRRLQNSPRGPLIGEFAFDWIEAPARGTDRDLLDLMNLLAPDASYPTAAVIGRGKADHCSRPPRIVAFGGSFLREIVAVLAEAPCPPDIEHWFYVRGDKGYGLVRYHNVPGDVTNGEKLTAKRGDISASVGDADIVLLEENESNIAGTEQVGNLWAALSDAW